MESQQGQLVVIAGHRRLLADSLSMSRWWHNTRSRDARHQNGKTQNIYLFNGANLLEKTPECFTWREEFSDLRKRKYKSGSAFVIFIKRCSFMPFATRPRLRRNQTHLFSPARGFLLTAAFSAGLVKRTHQVASFTRPPRHGAQGKLLWPRKWPVIFRST